MTRTTTSSCSDNASPALSKPGPRRPALVVGFAAETENLLDYAARKLQGKNLDLIVANNVANPQIGFNSEDNAVSVIDRELHATRFAQASKGHIARQLIAFIAARYHQG